MNVDKEPAYLAGYREGLKDASEDAIVGIAAMTQSLVKESFQNGWEAGCAFVLRGIQERALMESKTQGTKQ